MQTCPHRSSPHQPACLPACPDPLRIPQVVFQALLAPGALNKSFDLVSKPEGEGQPTSDWAALFAQTTAGL